MERSTSARVKKGRFIRVKALITLTPASCEASCSTSRLLQNLGGDHPLEGPMRVEPEQLHYHGKNSNQDMDDSTFFSENVFYRIFTKQQDRIFKPQVVK